MRNEQRNGISAVYVVFKHDDHTIFHRQRDVGYLEGAFKTPHCDATEDDLLTRIVQREAREELGIELPKNEACIAHIRNADMSDGSRVIFAYTASAWDEGRREKRTGVQSELAWCPTVSDDIIPYVREALNRIDAYSPT